MIIGLVPDFFSHGLKILFSFACCNRLFGDWGGFSVEASLGSPLKFPLGVALDNYLGCLIDSICRINQSKPCVGHCLLLCHFNFLPTLFFSFNGNLHTYSHTGGKCTW